MKLNSDTKIPNCILSYSGYSVIDEFVNEIKSKIIKAYTLVITKITEVPIKKIGKVSNTEFYVMTQ